ncbi:hypothetical protein MJO29_004674 [Puccinia striiformis f. sp. tritici]|nr:hypothetical protein MJO29_004674 [Puccinia striiformis f. sp. tritici]
MKLELEDKIQQQEEETVVIVAVTLLLTTLTHFGTQGIPYNDLPLSSEDYTITILQGNPCHCLPSYNSHIHVHLQGLTERPNGAGLKTATN